MSAPRQTPADLPRLPRRVWQVDLLDLVWAKEVTVPIPPSEEDLMQVLPQAQGQFGVSPVDVADLTVELRPPDAVVRWRPMVRTGFLIGGPRAGEMVTLGQDVRDGFEGYELIGWDPVERRWVLGQRGE